MNQEIYNGIINVLQRGAGVMAAEYCQAFTNVVVELQKRLKAEEDAKAKAKEDAEIKPVEAKPEATKKG